VYAEWKLTDTAIERIERLRDGGDLTIYPGQRVAHWPLLLSSLL
jgi:hypothetical protein